jgi:hypothetical protein
VDRAVVRKSRGRQRLYALLLATTDGKLAYHGNVSNKQLAVTFRALADQLDPPKGKKPEGEVTVPEVPTQPVEDAPAPAGDDLSGVAGGGVAQGVAVTVRP